MNRPLYLIATPATLLAAAYIITGHFWVAFDIALTVASFALALALVDALDQIDAQNAEADRVERETEAEMQRLHQELAEAQIAGGTVLPFPSIPKQRLPLSREEWDAIEAETVVHDAWLERLITRPFEDGAS